MSKQTQPIPRVTLQRVAEVTMLILALVFGIFYFLWARHHLYFRYFNFVGIYIALSFIFGVIIPYFAFRRRTLAPRSANFNAILSIIVSVTWIIFTLIFTLISYEESNMDGGLWGQGMTDFAFQLFGYVLFSPLLSCGLCLLLARSYKETE